MNIIALSLGLVPVPALPPAVRERQSRIAAYGKFKEVSG